MASLNIKQFRIGASGDLNNFQDGNVKLTGGDVSLYPEGNTGTPEPPEHKIKFESSRQCVLDNPTSVTYSEEGDKGLEFGTFTNEHSSLYTKDYRFRANAPLYAVVRETPVKPEGSDKFDYPAQADGCKDVTPIVAPGSQAIPNWADLVNVVRYIKSTQNYQTWISNAANKLYVPAAGIDGFDSNNMGKLNYLCFTSTGDTVTTLIDIMAEGDEENSEVLEPSNADWEYSYNKETWNAFGSGVEVSLSDGQSAYFRGNGKNTNMAFSTDGAGTIAVSGDVTTLLNGTGNVLDLTDYPGTFYDLFNGNTHINSANLTLPSTTLSYNTYTNMFKGCTNLSGTINIAATSPYFEEGETACRQMFTNAGSAEGAGGTINVGGSDAATWASAAGIDTAHWTINVINDDE